MCESGRTQGDALAAPRQPGTGARCPDSSTHPSAFCLATVTAFMIICLSLQLAGYLFTQLRGHSTVFVSAHTLDGDYMRVRSRFGAQYGRQCFRATQSLVGRGSLIGPPASLTRNPHRRPPPPVTHDHRRGPVAQPRRLALETAQTHAQARMAQVQGAGSTGQGAQDASDITIIYIHLRHCSLSYGRSCCSTSPLGRSSSSSAQTASHRRCMTLRRRLVTCNSAGRYSLPS